MTTSSPLPHLPSAVLAAADAPEPGGVAGWAVSVMEALGAVGAGLLIALENLFPPLPSEAILPLAGFAASRGDLNLVAALVWTTVGSVLGALFLYWVGHALGTERIRRAAEKMPLVDAADVEKTMAWFHRHGDKAVFFGRMLPVFRSLISVPAGIDRMPLGRFTLLTFLGSALWNAVFVVGGYFLGERWHLVEEYAGIFQKVVILLVVLGLLYWLVQKLRRRGRK